MRLALDGELVPDAVNVAGGVIDPYVRPGIPLVEKLGQFFAGLAHAPLTSLDVEVRGELAAYDVSVLKLAALKGIFTNIVSETVSYVNAPLLAEQRGIEVRLIVEAESAEYRNVITLRGALSDGTAALGRRARSPARSRSRSSSASTATTIEVPIEQHHIVMLYTDRPGIVAIYGQKFGDAGINIAGLQVARRDAGGQALTVLTVDSPVPDEMLDEVREAIQADLFRQIEITEQSTRRPDAPERCARRRVERRSSGLRCAMRSTQGDERDRSRARRRADSTPRDDLVRRRARC